MESLTATPPLPLVRQQQGMGVWRVGEMEAHMWARAEAILEQCDQTLRFSAKPADLEGLLRNFFLKS